MADRETYVTNFAQAALTSEMGSTDLEANVDSTSELPVSPAILVIEPDSASRREVVLFDGTFTSTKLVASAIGNRYLAGSAATSGLVHPSGSVVWSAPLAQHLDDANDRVDAAGAALTTHKGAFDGDHGADHDGRSHVAAASTFRLDQVAAPAAEVGFADNLLTRAVLKDYSEAVNAKGAVTTALAIDYTAGQVVTATLGGDPSVSISNPPATAGSLRIVLTQDATGSRTVTWPASFKWAGGTAPTLSTAASAVDVIAAFSPDGGTTWYAHVVGQAYA